jgi:hypothetical protein
MEDKATPFYMRIFIKVINPPGIKGGGPSFDAMHLISFFKKEFCEIRSVLPGNTAY